MTAYVFIGRNKCIKWDNLKEIGINKYKILIKIKIKLIVFDNYGEMCIPIASGFLFWR